MEQNPNNAASVKSGAPAKIPTVDISKVGTGAWGIPLRNDTYHPSSDANLFSSSLPVLPHKTLSFTENSPDLKKLEVEDEGTDPFEDMELNAIGNLLPDDEDELLAGIMDDFDLSELPTQVEDLEECDLFGSGGGMELDFDLQDNLHSSMSKLNISDGVASNGMGHYALPNGSGTVVGEHPYGEHPSRTLFVRNINSNVEDSELRSLFEQYGDIRTLYTACKHRGFVMISYYDIRDARTAMRALQNRPLRRRKLDIHFSIPKDNPSEKDINQGTLVVFNLDASVSNDDLRKIFGVYGEVKEIRETPQKRHHKFIEFYDVRSAEAALRALNKSEIAGKRIKLEPSRPGGARRNLMQQLSQELEQEEVWSFRHQVGSPVANSPPGNWGHFGSPVDHSPLHVGKSPGLGTFSPVNGSSLTGLASILHPHVSSPTKLAPIGKDQTRAILGNQIHSNNGSWKGSTYQLSQSFPDQKLSTSSATLSAFGESKTNTSGVGTLSGPEFLWGSPNSYSDQISVAPWPTSSVGRTFSTSDHGHGFPHTSRHGSFLGSDGHHVGSAPSGVPLNRHFGFFPGSPETSLMSPGATGGMGLNRGRGSYMMNIGSHATMGAGIGLPATMAENGSPNFQMMSMPRHTLMFPGNGSYSGPGTIGNDGFAERIRSRRIENSGNQIDVKKQYQLDLDKISSGEDTRTTLMIKNIPNKYTSKMLLAAIDENHRGTYDFLYLPIDFKAFNGKKWEKFNSEKVASLAYARIQGKAALVAHFQNSSLMNEDKRCRPILFHSENQEVIDEESLVSGNLNICIRQPDGSYSGDSLESPEDGMDEKPEKS
ncbi:hypothetical protein Tsubulata_014163 [Turnera subulata]|uniref:RRM domain-containing protein n=1 Tax=Turnera subulata TaxID=218843 RepID=A0A9Q0FQB4_9ROSI|nr:hypothetical protein Tsubulata_014163 [Turnera subulata]